MKNLKKAEKRQQKEAKQEIFRVAKWISREVKTFWGQIGVLVKHKQQRKLDEKRQQVLNEHLDFLVDQTQKYSTMLARDLVIPEVENGPFRY
jgi:E1A-binding protein p400